MGVVWRTFDHRFLFSLITGPPPARCLSDHVAWPLAWPAALAPVRPPPGRAGRQAERTVLPGAVLGVIVVEPVLSTLVAVVPVVEADLLPRGNGRGGVHSDVMIAAHGHDASACVRTVVMVDESRAVPHAACIDHLRVVQVEQVRRRASIIDLAAPIGLAVGDEFSEVL